MDADKIRELLLREKVATMSELKEVLGTEVDMTVFRKLQELAYRTSYSHRGKYYTLDEVAEFDPVGLWSFRSVWFSKFGTLLRTAEALVGDSEAGYYADELEALLHVGVRDALRRLAEQERIFREKVQGRFLHLSIDPVTRRRQLRARQLFAAESDSLSLGIGARMLPDELKAAIVLFFALLDEKQRRLYAGLESLKHGHGGDQKIADLLGVDPSTVARGRRELLDQDVEVGRVRKRGGGRKRVEKKRLP